MNRKRWVGISTGVVVALLAVAAALFLIRQEQSSSPRKINVAQFGDLLLYMPLYIAEEKGLFSKRGLQVEITSTGGDDKTYAAVLSGSAQFGIADPTFVAIAYERGQPGRVVALLIDGVPNYGVAISLQAGRISSPADLAGKTVATVPAPSTSYALVRKLYQSAGLAPSIYQVAAPGLIPSLKSDEVDYALLIEPWVSAVLREGGIIGFSLMDYYRHFALTGVTTSPKMLEESPKVVIHFLEALIEGTRLFYEAPALALRVAKQRFPGVRHEDLEAGLQRMRVDKIYPLDLRMTQEAWAAAVNLRYELGDIERAPAPMSEYVDTQAVSRARENVQR